MLKENSKFDFPIPKKSYAYIVIGLGIVVLGFLLMMGGGSDDPNIFDESIFSFRRVTLAPLVVLAGFCFVGWSIMRKPKGE